MKTLVRLLLALTACTIASAQKFEGLALTPPMGWNTWNSFASNINESLVKETAQAMIDNGMRDAGYVYVVLDDTWSTRERDANGDLVADPEKFPSGLKALSDWLHERGFKFGIYNCAGKRTCAGFPGGWGHEFQDARKYASWGVDYLKYDWCEHGDANAKDAYARMSEALRAAGRPIVFSLCEWGQNRPWEWAAPIAHLWRTTGDIYDSYDGRKGWESGWKLLLNRQYELVENIGADGIGKYAGPGHWNDPDMLEVGNEGLSIEESRSHFSFWCMLAAPLMAGNDVRHMSKEIRDILTNKELLAINQDSLGKQGYRVLSDPSKHTEVWVRELANKEWAVAVLNTGDVEADIPVEWSRYWTIQGTHTAHELWTNKDVGDTSKSFHVHLKSHDTAVFRLKPKS